MGHDLAALRRDFANDFFTYIKLPPVYEVDFFDAATK